MGVSRAVDTDARQGSPRTAAAARHPVAQEPRIGAPTVSEDDSTHDTAYLVGTGNLIDHLKRCMLDRLAVGRSGWSSAEHLRQDVERMFGVRAPVPAVELGLWEIGKRQRVQVLLDDAGTVWYRIRID